jgi:hypothetical protein
MREPNTSLRIASTEHHALWLARRIRRILHLSMVAIPACSVSSDFERREVCLNEEGDVACKPANAVTAQEMSSFPELFVSVESGPVRTVEQRDRCCYRVLISGEILDDPTTNTSIIEIISSSDGGIMQRLNWCFNVDLARTCAAMSDAGPELQASLQGRTLESIESGPTRDSRMQTSCCYTALLRKKYWSGRPYVVCEEEGPLVAPLGSVVGWTDSDIEPDTSALNEQERATLAAFWSQEGAAEHASVASFGRFAMELLAMGAPSDLVAGAHQAALEEVRHARLCFALARAYAGRDVSPGAFPLGSAVPLRAHDALVGATIIEGCVNETIASLVARERLLQCRNASVRRVLSLIADDEARHAELAWRCLQWLLERGTESTCDVARRAFANAQPGGGADNATSEAEVTTSLAAHGLLANRRIDAVASVALREVVLPNASALLASTRSNLNAARA